MKNKMRLNLTGLATLLMLTTLMYGCESGSNKKPERKKMPELVGYDGFYDGGFNPGGEQLKAAFAGENVTIETASGPQNFVSIPLPDASLDSLAVNLLNSIKPLALPLLNNWAREHKSGVLLDLCARHTGSGYQGNFTLNGLSGFALPVIIRWDRASAYRLTRLNALVQNMPAISLNFISGDNPLFNGTR
jgi:hypothetical protein